MRLIDADKIEDYLENICDNERDAWCLVNLLSHIDDIPTAYNIDEVINKLNDIVVYQNHAYDIKGIDYDKAVDIIRKGRIDYE